MDVYINTFGTSLRIQNGMLSVKKEDQTDKIPLGKIKKLFITKNVFLSSDVIYQCIEHGVDLLITERNGKPIGRLWNNKFGSISSLRKKQLDFSKSDLRIYWIIKQQRKKLNHQKELLSCLLSVESASSAMVYDAISSIDEIDRKISKITESDIKLAAGTIRGFEGTASRIYFKCINKHLPFIYQFKRRTRRPAKDMFNAMLNYAYGILYGHVESALIKVGLDPFIGFFHRDEYNRPVLSYDVIEVFRPWTDWVVLHLCFNEVIDESMFQVQKGAYWLHGDSKRILIQHFTDFFDEVVDFEGKKFSRFTHLERHCRRLCQKIEEKIK